MRRATYLMALVLMASRAWAGSVTWVTQPTSSVAGHGLATVPVVEVRDDSGNPVTSTYLIVYVSLKAGTGNPAAHLGDTLAYYTSTSTGQAGLYDCVIDRAGTGYVLTATVNGYGAADSDAFDVTYDPFALKASPCMNSVFVSFRSDEWNSETGRAVKSAAFYWRKLGDTNWIRGKDFVPVVADTNLIGTFPVPDPRWYTVFLGAEPGTPYEFRALIQGEDDQYPAEAILTGSSAVTTMTSAVTDPPLVQPIVVSDLTTSADIFNAFISAVATPAPNGRILEFQTATPGGTARVRASLPGSTVWNYYRFTGAEGAWMVIRTRAGDRITFDGLNATYDVTGAAADPLWELVTDTTSTDDGNTGGTYGITAADMIYRTTAAGLTYMGRVWTKDPTTGIFTPLSNCTAGSAYYRDGLSTLHARAGSNDRSWAFHRGRYYVRLTGGAHPATVRMGIPSLYNFIYFGNTHHIRFTNLAAEGFVAAVTLAENTSDVVIDHNTFHGCSVYAQMVNPSIGGRKRVVIDSNTMTDAGWAGVNWGHVKGSADELIAVNLRIKGFSFRDNTVGGTFNGFSYTGTQSLRYDGTQDRYLQDCEVVGNTFTDIADDATEPELWVTGWVLARNHFLRCYKGNSSAPIVGGPVYLIYNTFLGRGEYVATGDKQAFTKFGNSQGGDTGYKFFANNSVVNVNDDTSGVPLPGLMSSDWSYNTHIYNNYIVSDWYPVDWGYGAMGYPHIFDFNRYRCTKPGVGYPGYANAWAIGFISPFQGDAPANTGNFRQSNTFLHWQQGYNDKTGGIDNWPGYDGTVQQSVTTTTGGGYFNGRYYPPQAVTWAHDPNSTYAEGGHELVDPYNGDWTPVADFPGAWAGTHLDGITQGLGAAWADLDQGAYAAPTIGAVPAAINVIPTVVLANVRATVNKPVTVRVAATDIDGTLASLDMKVTSRNNQAVRFTSTPIVGIGTRSASVDITFTPTALGDYVVTVTAIDNAGGIGTATGKVTARKAA